LANVLTNITIQHRKRYNSTQLKKPKLNTIITS